MKIKLIELFNKMVNKEELPKKIKYNNTIFELDAGNAYYCYDEDCAATWLSNELILNADELNTETEIIEENKIEKIEICTSGIMGFDGVENITFELKNKINELIDEVNNLKEK